MSWNWRAKGNVNFVNIDHSNDILDTFFYNIDFSEVGIIKKRRGGSCLPSLTCHVSNNGYE